MEQITLHKHAYELLSKQNKFSLNDWCGNAALSSVTIFLPIFWEMNYDGVYFQLFIHHYDLDLTSGGRINSRVCMHKHTVGQCDVLKSSNVFSLLLNIVYDIKFSQINKSVIYIMPIKCMGYLLK